jgi:hypothetical protein
MFSIMRPGSSAGACCVYESKGATCGRDEYTLDGRILPKMARCTLHVRGLNPEELEANRRLYDRTLNSLLQL